MLLTLSTYLTDEAKLDRLLPYVMELYNDEAPVVRAAALRTALQIVRSLHPFHRICATYEPIDLSFRSSKI